jgi:hypothetical protein
MAFNPAIMSLLLASWLIALVTGAAALLALPIVMRWDLASGSELQLRLERRTYLLSVLLAFALALEVVSLLLFVYAAESLHTLFTGAMCAAGTFGVNRYGYPALIVKTANTLLAGTWLVLNHADSLAEDYPLVRVKYALLIPFAPLVIAEAALLTAFALGLDPDVITSCCGTLFSAGREAPGSAIASLPTAPTLAALYAAITVSALAAFHTAWRGPGRAAYVLGAGALASFLIGIAALIACVSPYVYELPTHRCPFCMLQADYGAIGYALYGSLFVGAIAGMGAGAVAPFRGIPSMGRSLPGFVRRLALAAGCALLLFAALTAYAIVHSSLR